jgi:hypothetical protein
MPASSLHSIKMFLDVFGTILSIFCASIFQHFQAHVLFVEPDIWSVSLAAHSSLSAVGVQL